MVKLRAILLHILFTSVQSQLRQFILRILFLREKDYLTFLRITCQIVNSKTYHFLLFVTYCQNLTLGIIFEYQTINNLN